jgi:hypothetical protein
VHPRGDLVDEDMLVTALAAAGGTQVDQSKPYAELW